MSGFHRVVLDAPSTPASRIQIAKLGKGYKDARYGTFDITAREVQSWAQNLFRLPGGRAPIDLDHSADRPGAARNTEAAGWITAVELADGVPTATVEWTSVGRSAIEDKRYLFFSPTYGPYTDEQGATHPDTLVGGALTNRPFLHMPTVCLSAAAASELPAESTQGVSAAAADTMRLQAEIDRACIMAEVDPDLDFTEALAVVTLMSGEGKTYSEALIRMQRGETAADALTVDELVLNSDLLDTALRGLCREKLLDYGDALTTFHASWERATQFGEQDVSAARVLAYAGLKTDLRVLAQRDQIATRTLAAHAGAQPPDTSGGIERDPRDGTKRVRLPAHVDRDARLADDLDRARDYRRLRDLGAYEELDQPPEFVAEWRDWTDAGFDLAATRELEAHDRDLEHLKSESQNAEANGIRETRAANAKRAREQADELKKKAQQLERGR